MTNLKNKDAERLNPCLKEQVKSYECLNKNGYDQTKCQEYFDNYNVCKKFWGKIYRDRKAKGLHPFLPDIEERQKIKDDFFKSFFTSPLGVAAQFLILIFGGDAREYRLRKRWQTRDSDV